MMGVEQVLADDVLRRELVDAWKTAFASYADLESFLQVELNRKLDDFGPREKLANTIGKVALDNTDDPEWVIKAFRTVARFRNANSALRSFGEKTGWLEPEAALASLEDLAEQREAGRLLESYVGDIKKTAERADAVGHIKQLHDLVDYTRRTVYLPLRTFNSSDMAGAGARHSRRMKNILLGWQEKMQDAAKPPRFPEGEFPWIEGQISYAAEALQKAADQSSGSHLREAVEWLREVVEVELSNLDDRLRHASGQLDLATLATKLRALYKQLKALGIAPDQLAALMADIETIEGTDARLTELLVLHRAWQRLDSALAQLENALDQSLDAVRMRWKVLRPFLTAVSPRGLEDCVRGLQFVVDGFEDALAEGDSDAIKKVFFPTLATLLRDRFTSLDKDLVDQCGIVQGVGISLNTVLEKLHAR